MVGKRQRVVSLSRSLDGDEGKMLVQEIDAEGIFPVSDSFLVEKSQIPSASTVCFGHRPQPAQLIGNASNLLDRAGVSELGVGVGLPVIHQAIDSRHVGKGIHSHVVRRKPGHRPLVLPVMPGKNEAVLGAIIIVRLCPSVDE